MADRKKPITSAKKSISIGGDVVDSVVIVGNKNTVNQTFFQKVVNIFKSDSETLEQRNRRILLGHVENAWIKGVLDASLHGAALLDLGIKPDPEAVTKYPWAIKKESTDETLPAGTSMLEIFDSIGMGRSLLILGAPGSGKTTMLLELARQLIQHAREDVTYPIPMVFNLASWTEKLTLADWLAQELNNLYSVPRKTAPDWVKGNKLLLLLDGLDEVRQESRAKCVEAINAFRKEHGLTSLAVCSRSQDYADLNAKLSFEGAIEVQPLTQKQIIEFFNRFGKEMAGLKSVLKKDSALLEMAETPLFLSIMIMAYRDKQEDIDILVSQNLDAQRKHLFDNYIERMFERPRSKNVPFKKQDVSRWLAWLGQKMINHNAVPYLIESMQPQWLDERTYFFYSSIIGIIFELSLGGVIGIFVVRFGNLILGLIVGLIAGLLSGLFGVLIAENDIQTTDSLLWDSNGFAETDWETDMGGMVIGIFVGTLVGLFGGQFLGVTVGLFVGLTLALELNLSYVIGSDRVEQITHPGERLFLSAKNSLLGWLIHGLSVGLVGLLSGLLSGWLYGGLTLGLSSGLVFGLFGGLIGGIFGWLSYGGLTTIRHYTLRFAISRNKISPQKLIPFLDHCVDLIFLRRVGGGYIFVHRLLMEHFAEMYVETPTSNGNQK